MRCYSMSIKKIADFIDSIYHASDNLNHWNNLLRELCELLPGAKAAIVHRKIDTTEVVASEELEQYIHTANIDVNFALQYKRYRHADVWTNLNRELNPRESVVNSQKEFRVCSSYIPRKLIVESMFYNDFAKSHGVEDYLVLQLFQYGDYYTTLTFLVDNKNHSIAKALPILNYLAPHIQRAAKWSILKNPELLKVLRENTLTNALAREYSLTPEEAKVAIAYSQSGDREKISQELGKSINTLKTHQKNIYKKMELTHSYRKRNCLVEKLLWLDEDIFD
jgi:DNA-binding CsgD family transcriptional regulator